MNIKIFSLVFSIYLLNIGLNYYNKPYLIISIIWLLSTLFIKEHTQTEYKIIYGIIIYLVPAFIMTFNLFINSYKTNDFYGRISSIIIFFINIYYFHDYLNMSDKYIYTILFLTSILYIIRKIQPKHYDDIHPLIELEMEYLDKSDILFVIPKFKNKKITDNIKWCNWLKNYSEKNNKILALHGINHNIINGFTGEGCEFKYKKNKKDIIEAIELFNNAFGYKPKYFKAPCYILSKENEKLLKELGLIIIGPETLIFNKVYHSEHKEGPSIFTKLLDFFNNLVDLY